MPWGIAGKENSGRNRPLYSQAGHNFEASEKMKESRARAHACVRAHLHINVRTNAHVHILSRIGSFGSFRSDLSTLLSSKLFAPSTISEQITKDPNKSRNNIALSVHSWDQDDPD